MARARTLAAGLAALVALAAFAPAAPCLAAAKPVPSAGDRLVVRLYETVPLPALRIVTLGEVADVEGTDALDAARVGLGPGPAPGRKRGITRASIMTALLREGFRRDAIRFAGPTRVVVAGQGQALDRRRVEAAVAEWLDGARERELPDGSEVTLRAVQVPPLVRITTGVYDIRLEAVGPLRSGTNRLTLVVAADGVPRRRVPITTEVQIEGPVVVLLRDVPAGARIAAADVAIEQREWPRFGASIADPAEVIGRVTRRPLSMGDVLTGRDVGPNWAVTAGEPIRATFHRGAVRLAIETTARGNGEIGAIVPVNGASGSLVRARVVAPGEVVLLGSDDLAAGRSARAGSRETDR